MLSVLLMCHLMSHDIFRMMCVTWLYVTWHKSLDVCQSFVFTDTRVFMTIAVDLVIIGIQEPVRFLIETKAKIFPTNERFWYFSTKPHIEQFILKLQEVPPHVGLFWTCFVRYGGGNSTAAEEVFRFQHLLPNPQLVDARKGIQSKKTRSNIRDSDQWSR